MLATARPPSHFLSYTRMRFHSGFLVRACGYTTKRARIINPRRACAARVTVVVPCVCVCVCFQGLHLRLVQLSDKLGILVISVSCSLVFKFGVFRIIAFWRLLVLLAAPFYILRACVYIQRTRVHGELT